MIKAIKTLLLVCLLFTAGILNAQTYVVSGADATTCSGTFRDAGNNGNYGPNTYHVITLCPDTPGSFISLDFTMFNVEANFDFLCVYDGSSTAATSLGCYDNNVPLLGTVTATNPLGCLTFEFDSDGSVQLAGWEATISCTQPCQTVISQATFNPAPDNDGVIRLCQGDVLQMNGDASYPVSGTGYVQSNGTSTFEWTTQDGAAQNGQNVNHTFNTEGAYLIQLEVTDVEGCSNANDIDQHVYVSTTPIFAGTVGSPDPICLGEQSTFTGVVTPVEFEKVCTVPTFPPLALPDGSGVSYSTSVNLDCYGSGQTLDDVNDLLDICVNMEHSYMGDLDIVIECPSGQQVTLIDYPNGGGGTYLGVPVDNDATPGVQGTGFDYCWSPTANNGDWGANSGGTLPAGTYETTESLAGLVGCDMNGDWTIIITDNLGSDNGFIFDWGINFDPSILPPAVTFTPTIVSDSWLADPSIVSGTNPIVVEPTVSGPACYTYEVTDDFGCSYDTTVCITVNPSPVLDPVADVVGCDSYTLPAISGTDLTGNEAYFTGAGGTGTQLNPGAVINTSPTTLYIYDAQNVAPFCEDEISFTITLDVTDPVINCPGNLTATCSIAEEPPYLTLAQFTTAGGTATDETSLDAASFTLLSELSDGNTCPEVVTRTYQIADDCGHTSTCVQTITIDDNVNPTASNLPAISVQCLADVPANNINDVFDEADNCTAAPIVAFISDVSNGQTCPETITRTYSVTDDCGNSITVSQQITINDTQNPTGSNLGFVNYECIGDVPAPNILDITDEADNCGAPTVAFLSDVSNGQTCPETIIRSYTITDDCGNSITRTQTILINDVTNPTASNPAPIAVQCVADVPAADITVVTDEADNCTAAPVVAFVSDVSDGNTCPEVITRTYSVTDECGNTINVTQTITVDDVTDPTGTAPADVVVVCVGDVPVADPELIVDEADNCTAAPVVAFVSDVSDGNTCPEIITRTYSITDDCGNTINVTQTITIDDNVNPTASNLPAISVQCLGDVPANNINDVFDEADNCTAAPIVAFISDVSNGQTCPETITRTYSVTDDCGNSITVSQQITINDTQNPTGSNLGFVNYECIGDVPAPNILDITDEADNCGTPTVAFLSDVSNGQTCPETIIRSYTITDDCGNSITRTQTILINDVTDPTASNPAPIAVECVADVPAADITVVTDEADNCTAAPVVAFVSDVSDGNTCPEVITRTYSVTDECGNTINVTQTITVDDVTNPTASNPADINIAGGPAPAPDVTVVTDEADNCTVAPVVAFVSDVSDGGNCPETITRTYSVTDDCGNTINVTQLIIIGDPFPPTGTAPADITVECIGDVPAADPALIVDEADNNGVPVVTHLSDVSDGNSCPEVITRTYRITDACGNVTDVVQLITVDDTQDPTASNPVAVNVECIGDVPAADITVVTDEADNCTAAPVVAFVSDVSDGNTCPEVITRTYSVTDDCGNTINVTQTITVDDVTDPTGTAPADIVVECVGDVPAADPALILDEADNCTVAPVVAHVSDVSDGNTCPEVITRTYSITDDCGNVTNVTQTITVDDTTDPTASNPADINVAGGAAPAPDVTVVTDEADNCTAAPVVAFVSDVSDGGNCPETITRTYSVTDDCGNTINVTQLIIIGDAILPTASNPAPIAVQCSADIPAPDVNVVTDEADNGGVPVVAFVSDVSDGNTCPEVITRTYSVTDNCGNVINVTQTITVDDTQDPTASNPVTVDVECIGDVPAADITVVTDEADNCTAAPVVAFVSDVSDGNTCPEVITRTYSVTDDCGNTINVTQTITVDDVTDPTGTAPADVVVECIGDVPVADPALIVDEADNCTAAPVVAFVSDVSDGNTCPEVITRTYSITDDCGNVANVTQTITVDDTTDPTASNPADINIAGGPAPAPDVTVVTDEADNCTVAPVVAFVSDVSDGGNCPETITRTYSVTDDCGNTINVTQLIIIGDPFPPTGTAPADIAVQCIGDVPAADPALIVDEADNNGVPVVTHLSDVSDGNTCPEVITRTYRITDACGNVTDVVQLITVDDIQDPTASNPAAINVECIGDVPAADITVVIDEADNCTAAPVVAFVSDVSDGNTCPEVITRTYSVTDDCGNTINVTQTITVDDVTDPTGTAPADVVVECIGDVPVADPALILDEADNCTVAPVVAHVSDVSDGNTCPEVITRTYSITDECGNAINVTQTITVDDVTNPTASNPADIIAPGGPAPAPDVTVVTDEADNCTAAPVVAFVSDVSDGNPCPETITRTYSVTDDCGNQILVTQNVIITDPILPTGTAPADITVECIGDVPAADPTLIVDEADNNGIPVVTHLSDVSDGNTCPEVITRTYRITDACGNMVDVVQLITVDDTQDPTASNPVAVNVECIGDVPAADITVVTDEADNCTAAPLVAFVSDVSDGNTCPEVITRTYSVTDDCGNTINVTQTITVDDVTDPTGTAPADVVVECIGDVPAADPALILDEADNCTVAPVVAHVSDVSDGNTCPEVITRTYSITDECGNAINVTQTITVDDVTNPTASNPADLIAPGGPAPAPDVTVVTDEADNCTVAPVVAFVSDVSDGNPCPETITRTYSITDDCGNQILVTQNVIITDPILPTGTAPADIAVQCIGDVPAADPTLIVDEADNNGVPVVTHLSDVSDGNTCPEVITRTYRITDACGNMVDVVQLITVDDTQDPTASNPLAVNVECIGDVPAADITVVTDEADNCTAAPVVAFVSDVSDGNTCPEVITRTYSVTDDCGNTINVTQTITVDDVTNPTGTAPADVVVECIGDVPAADPALILDEADNCTVAPVVAHVSDVSDGNTCPEVITRTYSITDDCGNTINLTQTITVDDVTNPTASNPADVIAPGGPAPAPDVTVVTDEADNCTVAPVVAFVSDVSDGNPCPETITRTYSVTDDCGNQILVTQNVIITDPILPTGTAPADIAVQCIGDVPAADPTLIVDEADNNGVPVVTHLSDVSDGNTCPEVITRTYRITDNCGNFIDVVQLITVDDTQDPTASNPVAVNVECIGDIPAADITVVTDEADNCTAAPAVAFVSDVSDGNTCPEVITRTYSITDDCGNTINVTQTITVDDITNPTGTAPADVVVECIGDVPAADPALILDEADNCTVAPVVAHVSDVSDGNTCPEVITRTYSITDECGNVTNLVQTITVDDTTDPTASDPAAIAVALITDVPAPDVTVVTDEADNCTAAPVVAFVSDVSDGNTCPETITRTYSVTDDCGNTINVTQIITVQDLTPPTASNPAPVNVECIGDVPAPDVTVVTDEADNGGVPVVAFVSDNSDGNTCPEVITRTYSVTDDCGNSINVTQTITVHDITPPTASNPAPINVECIGDVPVADVNVVTDEADNCTAAPIVVFTSDVSDGNTCPETITRTFTIFDDCGNSTDVTQIITVNDITPPTASNPVAVNVECIGDVPVPDVTVVTDEADNCTAVPVVAFVSDVSDGNTCPEIITRTYSVTDDCGNTINVTQTITVDDITDPTASNPTGVTVAVIGDVPAPDVTVVTDEADNCTAAPAVAFVSDVSDGNTCPETITRTYSVTDDCGNTINVTQTITVSDVIPPTASNPVAVNVQCIGDVPVPDVLVVTDEADNSGAVPVVAFVSDVSDGNTCPETITRTYSVTDDCGNSINVTQQIIVNDDINPTASNAIATNVECIGDVPVVDVNVITGEADNCTAAPVVAFVSEVSDGNTCPEVITRTYSVTDDCGNSINVTHTITVNDITNPTASNPAAINVQCIGDVPAADITVVTDEADNCTVAPVVAFVSDVSDGNTCPETITRTYSVTDDCGNTINVTQAIIVNDDIDPTASNPLAVNVECIGDVPAPDVTVVTDEADNCTAAPVVAFVSDVSDGNTCPETITRTYSVTDDCGNSINVTQTITVNDVTNPTASNPADIVVSCASDVPGPDPTVVTDEADNCTAAPVVAFVSDVSDGNICAGEVITRTYSVTDDCGNTINVTQQISIEVLTPTVNAGLDQDICEGFGVVLTAENPNNATISWDNGVLDGVSFNPPVGTQTYTVTASQCGGECLATDQVDVTVHATPEILFTGDDLYACEPHTVNFTNMSTEQFDCVWDFGDGNVLNDCGPVSNTYLNAGLYDVTLTVTSDQGCVGTDTYTNYIEVVPYPIADFTFAPNELDILDTEVEFTNHSQFADYYTWSFGDASPQSNEENPTHVFPDATGGSYTVTLQAHSNAGCFDQHTAVVTIDDVLLFYVPNTFTPDGNSINNDFFPVFTAGYDLYDYHLMIFNRWGELIFESYNPGVGWDGTYGDVLVEDGVYIWSLDFGETMSDKRHHHRGHVTVLK